MRQLKLLMLSVLILAGSGCATMGAKTPEDIVAQRSQARLDALLKGDLEGAWKYTSPTYRQRVTPGAYNANVAGAVNWTAAKVDRVECEEERCEVRYQLTYNLPQLKMENTRPMNEVWIKSDGNWWIYHRR